MVEALESELAEVARADSNNEAAAPMPMQPAKDVGNLLMRSCSDGVQCLFGCGDGPCVRE